MHLPNDPSWREALKAEFDAPWFAELMAFVSEQRNQTRSGVFPPAYLMWTAFEKTPIDKVRVVIVGQDPYY
jgi:uracil-DNA glycosylase